MSKPDTPAMPDPADDGLGTGVDVADVPDGATEEVLAGPDASGAEAGAGADVGAASGEHAEPDDDRPVPSPLPSRRRLTLEALAMTVGGWLLALLYVPALRDSKQAVFADVMTNALGPDRRGLAAWLRDGAFPLWTRTTYGGDPYFANLQHGTAYPGSLLFLFGNTSTAMDMLVAAHLALALVGMWAYLRVALRTSVYAAVLGALCFAVGGVSLSHTVLADQFHVMCWMPLMFFTGHMALERRRLLWTVLTTLTIGMAFLAGHPEPWLYQMAALALYGLAWILLRDRGDIGRRALVAVRYLGGSVVLFVLLFGWQLLPTMFLMGQGYRSSPSFNQQYPLPKASAINALLPDFGRVLVGENESFIGTAALCLVGLAVVARRRGTVWLRVWLLVTAGAGLILALGLQNPVAAFLYHHVSLVKSFRVPSRYLLATYFALSVGAAVGLDELLYSAVGRWRQRLKQGGLAVAVLGVGGAFLLLVADITNDGASWRKWLAAAGVGGGVWLAATIRRAPRVALALALIVLTSVELYYARPFAEYRQEVPNQAYDDDGPMLRALGADGGRYITIAGPPADAEQAARVPIPADIAGDPVKRSYYTASLYTRLIARPTNQIAVHAETILGRDGGLLPLQRYRDFYVLATGAGGDINSGAIGTPPSQWNWTALDFLAIEWFLTPDNLPDAERAVLTSHGFHVDGHDAYVLRWRRDAPALARMVHDVDLIGDSDERTSRLSGNYPLLERAIVEKPVQVDPAGSQPDVVETTDVGNTSVTVRVTARSRGLLVLADPYYPGWRVSVDGRPAELLVADHAFRGVVLPAGDHTVRFTYVDNRFRLGLLLAGLTTLGLVATPIVARLVRRRRRRPAEAGT